MSNYWQLWPTQGEYSKDLNWGAKVAIDYLHALHHVKGLLLSLRARNAYETLFVVVDDKALQ